ncbi:hypothetical protein [Shimia sp. SDUM112013]|uniref:hypothetical protein n=1 Tax=Shimia sp. SDUM112013 TaxID=3136160 RepID=UPI0032F0742B
MRLMFCLLVLLAPPLRAEIVAVPYLGLRDTLGHRISFETLPQRAEPGFNLDHPLRTTGAWIGERFAGQSIVARPGPNGAPHDALGQENGHRPLTVRPGAPRRNLSVAYHRGFGSNAVLPLGQDGFDRLSGRGEGSLAVVFDSDQRAVGFRVHTDYAAPLGQSAPRGEIRLYFMTRMGHVLDVQTLYPGQGITEYGFEVADQSRRIAGLLITNTDPGGIAIDDILFQIDLMLF